MNFLKEVARRKLEEIKDLEEEFFSGKIKPENKTGENPFLRGVKKAKRNGKVFVISEFKKSSPSSGKIMGGVDIETRVKEYEENGASAISILTDKNWFNGSYSDLKLAANRTSLPVLMKEFIVSEAQIALGASKGADSVLLITKLLRNDLELWIKISRNYGLEPLVEVNSPEEAKIALSAKARIIGVNSRNLENLTVEINRFYDFANFINKHNQNAYFIAESGLNKREEVKKLFNIGYDGVLVGSRICKEPDGLEFLAQISNIKKGDELGVN